MKTNWQTKKIGNVCEIVNGGTPKTNIKKYWNGDILWITPKDMGRLKSVYVSDTERKISKEGLKNSSAKIIPPDSIILSSRAPIGYIAINKKEITTNQGCKGIIPKKEIDVQFLFYFLTHSADLLQKLGSGTTFKELSSTKLSGIEIQLPFLPEQHRIVKILDEVFEKTAKAKENAEKNIQNAKELFESYLQSIFTNSGKDWEEKNLEKIADIEYGYTNKAKPKGDYRYVRITDTDKNGLLTKENKLYIRSFKEKNKFILAQGDLLMARVGASFGNVLFFESDEPAIFASYLIRIKFGEKIVSKLYWYFSKSKMYWDQVRKLSSGSAQPQFNGGALKQIMFSYPKSISEQKSIVKKLDALSAETKKLEAIYKQKLADLEELKKSVLKKAFAGEL